jgi:hypothetical protein
MPSGEEISMKYLLSFLRLLGWIAIFPFVVLLLPVIYIMENLCDDIDYKEMKRVMKDHLSDARQMVIKKNDSL